MDGQVFISSMHEELEYTIGRGVCVSVRACSVRVTFPLWPLHSS